MFFSISVSAVKSLPPHVSVGGLPKSIVAAFLHSSPGVLKSMPTDQVNLNSIDAKLVGALMPFQKEGVRYGMVPRFSKGELHFELQLALHTYDIDDWLQVTTQLNLI